MNGDKNIKSEGINGEAKGVNGSKVNGSSKKKEKVNGDGVNGESTIGEFEYLVGILGDLVSILSFWMVYSVYTIDINPTHPVVSSYTAH